jgi:putative DNA primase/helicase
MDTQPDYGRVLARLEGVRPSRSRPGTWVAKCPVHGHDRSPSLSLWLGRDGRLMANCWGCYCGWRRVVEATGTEPEDWFPLREVRRRGRVMLIRAVYPYHAEGGALLYQTVRLEPKSFRQRRPDGRGGWLWNLDGVERVPYRLPELLARPGDPVCVVEGERDADALRALGLLATTNVGGAGKWLFDYGRWLAERRVVVLPDNDDPGTAHAVQVAGTLLAWGAASIRLVSLPDVPAGGDVSDFLAALPADGAVRRAALCRLVRAAPEWTCGRATA